MMKEIILMLVTTLNVTPMSSKYLLVELEDASDKMITPDGGLDGGNVFRSGYNKKPGIANLGRIPDVCKLPSCSKDEWSCRKSGKGNPPCCANGEYSFFKTKCETAKGHFWDDDQNSECDCSARGSFELPLRGRCKSTNRRLLLKSHENFSICKLKCANDADCKMFSHGDKNSEHYECLLKGGTFKRTDNSGAFAKYNYRCYRKKADPQCVDTYDGDCTKYKHACTDSSQPWFKDVCKRTCGVCD